VARLRVVILSHYYPPEVGAPQRRLEALAHGLAQRGAQVTVHTGFPHYPAGSIAPPYRNRPLLREAGDRVRVVRSAVYATPNRGVRRRLADHAVFAGSALLTGSAAGAADVVVAESPPLFLAAAAGLYSRGRGARLVLHVSDLWPDTAIELGALRSPVAIRGARWLERHAYRQASLIVAPTRGIVDEIGRRPEASGRVRLMLPSVDVERFAGPPLKREGPLRVLYAGTVGMAQGLGTLVQAAEMAGPEAVRVTIAGDGAEQAHLRQLASGVTNVEVLGAVTADAVPGLYADADVAAVLLRDLPLFRGALPSKMFEAMAAGRPLMLSAAGEAAELVRAGGAGLVTAPEDPRALADALLHAAGLGEGGLREMGERARALAGDFDRPRLIDRWYSMLAELMSGQIDSAGRPVAGEKGRGSLR
jgi:glycosyltransferase involved in cell wall biosynthesis